MSGRARQSGIKLSRRDAPVIMGMVSRGDRDHDIAAWFGVNQGRIAEVKDGTKFGVVEVETDQDDLPPRGPPGIKGRRLRDDVQAALTKLQEAGVSGRAVLDLRKAIADYGRNKT